MNKIITLLFFVVLTVGLTNFTCWADPCLGDFDCDGDVDGVNLAQFSLNFGLNDCSSSAFKILGTAEFTGWGITDFYSIGIKPRIFSPSEENSLFIKIKRGSISQRLLLAAFNGQNIAEMKLQVLRNNKLVPDFIFQDIQFVDSWYYSPVQTNDPSHTDLRFKYSAVSLLEDCGGFNIGNFILTVGYTGTVPPPGYEDYIVISKFDFGFISDPINPPQIVPQPVTIVATHNDDSKCIPKDIFSGRPLEPINQINIVKFGQERGADGPEERIRLENATLYQWYLGGSSGNIEHNISFWNYTKIIWSTWEQVSPGVWEEYQECISFDDGSPC